MPHVTARTFSRRQFLTSGELARLSNISKRSVVKAVASGRLRASSTVGGHYRIALAEARRFLKARGLDDSALSAPRNVALVVARDPFVVELLADVLGRSGLSAVRAANLFEAGALCAQSSPALLVVDSAAAWPGPVAVCRSIRTSGSCRLTRLVILTGREDAEAHRYRQAGADAVLGKPFAMAELKSVLASLDLAGPDKEKRKEK